MVFQQNLFHFRVPLISGQHYASCLAFLVYVVLTLLFYQVQVVLFLLFWTSRFLSLLAALFHSVSHLAQLLKDVINFNYLLLESGKFSLSFGVSANLFLLNSHL